MKRILSLAAAAALLSPLAADAQALQPNCVKACTVIVTMPAGCGSGIKVAPDPIVVPPGGEVEIEWRIESPGWAFDGANGIFIHQAGDFFVKSPGDSRRSRMKHKNKGARTFKYDVNLVDAKDNAKCKLDPTILDQ